MSGGGGKKKEGVPWEERGKEEWGPRELKEEESRDKELFYSRKILVQAL